MLPLLIDMRLLEGAPEKRFTPVDRSGGGRIVRITPENASPSEGPVIEAVYSSTDHRTPFAIEWPGQGSQKVGMGKGLRGKYVTDIYREAHEEFGFPVRQVSLHGPEEILDFTIITQPSLVTHNIARLEEAKRAHPEYFIRQPRYAAGLSLGEYSALYAAGVFPRRRDLFKLIRARSASMQYSSEYNPGGNVVFMTPGRIPKDEDPERYDQAFNEGVDELAKVRGLTVGIYYGHNMRVYAGNHEKLEALRKIARKVGGGKYLETVDVQASGPFHSDAMRIGLPLFRKRLRETPIEEAQTDVIANTTAMPIRDPKDIREELEAQLLIPVQWERTQEVIFQGAEGAIEMGQARGLTNSFRRRLSRDKVEAAVAVLSIAGAAAATVLTWKKEHDHSRH